MRRIGANGIQLGGHTYASPDLAAPRKRLGAGNAVAVRCDLIDTCQIYVRDVSRGEWLKIRRCTASRDHRPTLHEAVAHAHDDHTYGLEPTVHAHFYREIIAFVTASNAQNRATWPEPRVPSDC